MPTRIYRCGLWLVLGFVCAAGSAAGQESVNETVIAQIKGEAFQRSTVMDTLSWLSDVHGPRLTGSPALRKAAEWVRDQLASWGLVNAALEPYGSTGRGWTLERFSIEMTEPAFMRINGYPKAWSPTLASPLTGTPIVVDVKSKDDFEKYRGKIRGAIVMNGRPDPPDIGFQPDATRLTNEELKKLEGQVDPAANIVPGAPKSYWDEEDEWVKTLEKQREISLSLNARLIERVEGFSVVAEIPGTDPLLKSEVVMLGGHLDSWHSGTGAIDNGAGSAVAMEAMRVLKTLGCSRAARSGSRSGPAKSRTTSVRWGT